ncbi:MAG TPA: FAD-binding oxidoreductase [Actinomycetota bacterium]|nr:FAD-binding oxidoreductase [Actinomycetota bacterium]
MPSRASVVVVGGGVIGTSVAFHLAEAGVADVVLIERDELGAGSTSKAAGGVRAQFSDSLNIQLGAHSLRAFAEFSARPGQEIDFRRVGYLFLLSRPEDVAAFQRSIELQNRLGVPSRLVDPAEAARLSPPIDADGLLAAAFSPDDGLATPEAVVQGYAAGARRHGAHIETACELLEVRLRDEAIQAVVTSKGVVKTSALVCAAGAWSRRIGAMVGVDLPVTPYRRQVLLTEAVPGLPEDLPMTIDFASSFYFHREGPGLLMGMSLDDEPPGFNLGRDDAWIPRLAEVIARRAPSLAEIGVAGGWAGLYEVTPDHNALIGEAPRPARLLYATGFSGHGFLQGPAVGEVVRDLYLGRQPPVDVAPLSVDRFQRAADRPELNVV